MPEPGHRGVRPAYHDRQNESLGGPTAYNAAQADINGGKMDGFVGEQESGMARLRADVQPGLRELGGTPDVMGYHDGSDIPN